MTTTLLSLLVVGIGYMIGIASAIIFLLTLGVVLADSTKEHSGTKYRVPKVTPTEARNYLLKQEWIQKVYYGAVAVQRGYLHAWRFTILGNDEQNYDVDVSHDFKEIVYKSPTIGTTPTIMPWEIPLKPTSDEKRETKTTYEERLG